MKLNSLFAAKTIIRNVIAGAIFLLFTSGGSGAAESLPFLSQSVPTTTISVVTDQKFISQSGGNLWVKIQMNIPPGWHTYAPMQGSSYMPPKFKMDPSMGKVMDVLYPSGQVYSAYGKRYPVYFDRTYFLVNLSLGQNHNPTSNKIPLTVAWLACTDSQCVPQTSSVMIPIRYGPATPSIYYREIHKLISQMPKAAEVPVQTGQISWGSAILFAVLGGIALNVMPCVFPVLSLKLFQVLKAGTRSRRDQQVDLGIYAAGILSSFWLLGLLTLALRAAGKWAGWGFQYQSPISTAVLAVVFLAAGVFMVDWVKFPPKLLDWFYSILNRVGLSRSYESGRLASYFTGFFTVIAATPCTAPFMGAAVTYALSQSPIMIFAIFTCLGVGLASPVLVLGQFPSVVSKLPKPGSWMIITKRVLSIPLFLTALWLCVVAVRQIHPVTQKSTVEKVRQQIVARQPVLVDVTADWCLTCKVNEKVLMSSKVQNELRSRHIRLAVLDWTNSDPTVTQFLKQHGRSGVPAYFYFDGKSPTPRQLPQILTPANVMQSIDD